MVVRARSGSGEQGRRELRQRFRRAAAIATGALFVVLASCTDALHRDAMRRDHGSAAVLVARQSAQHVRHASVPCEACHEIVGDEYLEAKSWQCQECHADAPLGVHALLPADSAARECWSCHDFTGASERATPCITCHDKAQGKIHAIGPHDPKTPNLDCATCHRAHEQPALVTTRCESCHHEPVSGHDKPGIPITGCASCHGFHEAAAVASERCTNCHRQSRARVPATATFAPGHINCVTCHREHEFVKTEALECRGACHDKQVALADSKVKEHRCTGCHDKHDVRGPSLTSSCESCHADTIRPAHPKDPVTKSRCLGCHKPHAGPGAPLAVACSSCHREAGSDRGFHQGAHHQGPACRSCHEPHRFELAGTGVALCLRCHGDQPFENAKTIHTHAKHDNCFACHGDTVRHRPAGPRTACTTCHQDKGPLVRKGHSACVGCHDPHTAKQQASCGTCHADEARRARKDHKTCVNCHEPHGGTQKRACGSCHAAEATTAPKPHQQCTSCHDQHSTLVKTACGTCHTDRTTGVHAKVSCNACHRPHGPDGPASPPVCTTCHKDLPLMHQVQQHRDCKRCHRSHGDQPYGQRATCLTCHADRRDHEPTAPTCIGCHTFGGDT